MADNTVQFGITVDTSTVTSNLSQIQSRFDETTSAVASQWSETSSTVTVSLAKMADGAAEAAARTKEQMEKASSAVGLLGDLIGIKVPEGVQKMLSSSELIAPALEAAFAPLAVIALVQTVAQAIGKVNDLANAWRNLSEAEKSEVAAKASELRKQLEFERQITEIRREAILLGKTAEEQARLRAEWAKDDELKAQKRISDAHAELEEDKRILSLVGQIQREVQGTGDDGLVETPLVSDEQVKEAQKNIAELEDVYGKALKDGDRETAESAERRKLAEAQADNASIEAAKNAAQQRGAAARAAAQQYLQTLQNELQALQQNHSVSLQEELYFWKARLASAREYPEADRGIMARVGEIEQNIFRQRDEAARQAAQAQVEANERAAAQILSDAKAQNDAIIARNRERLETQAALYKSDIDQAKVNEQIKVQLAEADLARGRISKQQEILIVAAAKKEEIRLEIQAWKAIASIYDDQPKKVAEIEGKIAKLKAQYRLADAKAVADEAKATESTYRQLWTSVGNIFKSTVDELIQGHETVAQAVQRLLSGLLSDIANYLEQKAMKEAAALATSLIQKKTEAAGNISADSGQAFSAAFADSAAMGPEGLAAAPGVAAAAASATMSGGLALLASLDVGTWRVPFDMPAIVHSGEMVVPRFESDLFRNAVKGGGQGSNITVVVNHSVTAIDAESFQGVIRKHGTIIGNEVARALKRKGFAVS